MNNETFDKAQFIKDVQDNVKNLYRKTIKEATQQEIFSGCILYGKRCHH